MTIPVTTRSGKGSPLTPGEMDANLTNLARDATQAIQGNMRFANVAETQAFIDPYLAISPATFITAIAQYFANYTSSNFDGSSNPGFYKLQNGPYIQWGNVIRNSNTVVPTITFPKPMTTVYFITCIDANAGVGNGYIPKPANVGGTGFTITTDNFSFGVAAVQTFWLVIGL